jgi:hypothetical protein
VGLLASLITKRKPGDAMPSMFIAAGIGTAELSLRPSRAPDFEVESRTSVRPRLPRPGLGTGFCKASLMRLLAFAVPAAPASFP